MNIDSDAGGSGPRPRGRVLVVGSANMDLVVTCDRFPRPGETLFARGFGTYPGGKGANQAVACARLGAEVVFLGKMGKDVFRDQLVVSLEGNGVRLERLKTDPHEPTGIAVIIVDGHGQNEIVVSSGSNMVLTPADIEKEADGFGDAKVVLLQLEIPLETVERSAELAKAGGAIVILNPAPAVPLPDSLLRKVDILTPNEGELGLLTGIGVRGVESAVRAATQLVDRGVNTVVVTLGADGALCVDKTGSRMYSCRKVDVVDTTAAGDAFNGALAFSLAGGGSLGEAIDLANTVASYSVTRHGAQPSMPTLKDLRQIEDRVVASGEKRA